MFMTTKSQKYNLSPSCSYMLNSNTKRSRKFRYDHNTKLEIAMPSLPSPALQTELFFFTKHEAHHVPTSLHVTPKFVGDALEHHESHEKETPSVPHSRNTRYDAVSESHHEPVTLSPGTQKIKAEPGHHMLYFECIESPSTLYRKIIEKLHRHQCVEPTNSSSLR